jgi:hypothetical protein
MLLEQPTRRIGWGFAGGVVLASTAGCVAVPFALPPSQVTIGTGYRTVDRRGRQESDAPLQVRGAMHPFGFDPMLLGRNYDFGLGYMVDTGKAGQQHGGYFEVSGVIANQPVDGPNWLRLSGRAQLRVLFDSDSPRAGRGGALQITGEYAGFTSAPFTGFDRRGGVVGYGYGETAFGLYVETAYGQSPTFDTFSVSGGVLLRIPALVGLAYGLLVK